MIAKGFYHVKLQLQMEKNFSAKLMQVFMIRDYVNTKKITWQYKKYKILNRTPKVYKVKSSVDQNTNPRLLQTFRNFATVPAKVLETNRWLQAAVHNLETLEMRSFVKKSLR